MKTATEEERMGERPAHGRKRLCPYLFQPFERCFCTSTSSLDTEATVFYCGGNFHLCRIYKAQSSGKDPEVPGGNRPWE